MIRNIFILFFALIAYQVMASHIIGGKFTYRLLGSNSYEIKLTVYRDCSDYVDLDDAAVISIYSIGNNPQLVYNKDVPLKSRSTLPTPTLNPCFVPPYPVCVEQGIYIDTVMLPPNNYGYTLVYQKCCRNINIQNVLLPSMTGITLTTDIPVISNNASDFSYYPPIYVCQNDTFTYSFAATDADGDSLAYQFCDAFSGGSNINPSPNPNDPPPYTAALWTNGYTTANQISNNGGITLNQSTGLLQFIPSLIGQFAIAVSVLEYRNGSLIHTTRLEFEFNVVACSLTSSILTMTNICQGLSVTFKNKSTNSNAFHWDFGDNSSTADTSNLATPSYTFPSYGTYSISLVSMNTAYSICKDTATAVVQISPLLSPTLQSSYTSCFQNNQFNFIVGGSFEPSATFAWNFTSYSNSQFQAGNPAFASFTDPATKTISVIVSQFGCADTLLAAVSFSNPAALINSGQLNCTGRSLNFDNISTQATSFKWDFGVAALTSDTSNLKYPTFLYPSFGTFTITLVAMGGNCTDTLREPIIVAPNLSLSPTYTSIPQCFQNNSFNFFANGEYSSAAVFTWFFDANANIITSNQENPTNIHYFTPGNHAVKLVVADYGCERTRTELVKILPSPTVNAAASVTSGCAPLKVDFTTKDANPLWNFGGFSTSVPEPSYVFPSAGNYTFSISVTGANSCVGSKTSSIVVFPKPEAKVVVNVLSSEAVNNKIILTDSTIGSVFTYVDFGDNQYSDKRRNIHIYSEAGLFQYFLVSANGFGCSDTTGGLIRIDASNSVYVPNTFTPNDNNLNDTFNIKGENIKERVLVIFNRWGDQIFRSDAPATGWDGKDQRSGKSCPEGVYVYQIRIVFDTFGAVKKEESLVGHVYLYREP